MNDIIYDFYMRYPDLIRHVKSGGGVLCPTCNSNLLVVLDYNEIPKHGKPPGVYCLKDIKHVNITHKINKSRY